jgi:hypothetical protein
MLLGVLGTSAAPQAGKESRSYSAASNLGLVLLLDYALPSFEEGMNIPF